MTSPLLPLDALVGYTITRPDPHVYTLTPTTKGPAMPENRYPVELDRPRTTKGINPKRRQWNMKPCEYGHFDCSFAERGPCENEHRTLYRADSDDNYQSRAEWREVPQ